MTYFSRVGAATIGRPAAIFSTYSRRHNSASLPKINLARVGHRIRFARRDRRLRSRGRGVQANEEFVAFDFCLLFRNGTLATAGRDGVELPGGCIAAQPLRSIRNQLFGINGGPVATRTPDLYRVKVAL